MTLSDISDTTFSLFVSNSKSWKELMIMCGYNSKNNRKYVKLRIDKLHLNTDHFQVRNITSVRYTLTEILIEHSSYENMRCLKKRLIKELDWKYECSSCRLQEWLGLPIPLEIEHKNGVHNDNRIENLCFLCPNCHAQTDTYKGKNIHTYKTPPMETIKICPDCKTIIYKDSIRCVRCNAIDKRKVLRPTDDELIKLYETHSMKSISKIYNVSDKTISKWIKNIDLKI